MNLSKLGGAMQKLVNMAAKVVAEGEAVGISPTQRKKRTVKKAKNKPASESAAEGDEE